MKRNFLKSLALTLTFSSFVLPTVNAFASELPSSYKSSEIVEEKTFALSIEDEKIMRETFAEDNIPVETQDKLIQIKKEGKLWDVEKKEKFNKIPSDFFESLKNNKKIKYTFNDGSYLILINKSLESNSNKTNNLSITKSNMYERNIPDLCIEARYGGSRMSITADVSMFYGGTSQINSVESLGDCYIANGALVSDGTPYISKKKGDNSKPATAKYKVKFTRDNILGSSKTATLVYTLYVNGSKYWADVVQS